ncbi:DUF3899 domain-containing protein [Bacillus gobiensis]
MNVKELLTIRPVIITLFSCLLLIILMMCFTGGFTLLNLINALFLVSFLLILPSLSYIVFRGGFFKGISYSFRRLLTQKERDMYGELTGESPESNQSSSQNTKEFMKTLGVTGFVLFAIMLVLLMVYYFLET